MTDKEKYAVALQVLHDRIWECFHIDAEDYEKYQMEINGKKCTILDLVQPMTTALINGHFLYFETGKTKQMRVVLRDSK